MSTPLLVLASVSPRRQELLRLLGLPFSIDPSRVEEQLPARTPNPEALAVRLAEEKAHGVAAHHPGALVIGADTIVVVDDHVLGKPMDEEDAAAMLRALSGRTHAVITGLALVDTRQTPWQVATAAERTEVRFRHLAEEEIRAYVATGEPMDKAGAYAIQGRGAILIEGINGDYPNVVGLPLTRLALMLRAAGVVMMGVTAEEGNCR
ncbi:MAG: septum formation inhibitor Maf [Armatimonadetes bacterium]|nr:septum formation inhibitor Maf [Armatimonadota bacterium]